MKIAWIVFETLRQSPWFYAQALKLHAFTTMKVQFHGGYEIRSLEKTAILRVVLDSLQKKKILLFFLEFGQNVRRRQRKKGHYNNIYSLMDYSSSESCICHPPQRWPAPSKHFLLGKSTCYMKCIKCIFCSSNFPNFRDFELSQKSLVEKVTWLIALFWLAKRVNERDFFLLWAKLRPLAKRFWLAESQQTLNALNNKSTLNCQCQCQYCVNIQQTKLETRWVESVINSKNSWNRLGDFWTRFEWFVFKNLLPGKTEWSKCTKDISARICQW